VTFAENNLFFPTQKDMGNFLQS